MKIEQAFSHLTDDFDDLLLLTGKRPGTLEFYCPTDTPNNAKVELVAKLLTQLLDEPLTTIPVEALVKVVNKIGEVGSKASDVTSN